MDIAPLQKWLDLPPGPWPPDDRALLGLSAFGSVDAAEAEQNALARMEQLRPHQLVHPELVTEGMNRLAQALIAITSLPVVLPTTAPAINFAPDPGTRVQPSPTVLDAEVMEAEVVNAAPNQRSGAAPVSPPAPVILLDDPAPVSMSGDNAPPGTALVPGDRRKAYRELVFLRRIRGVWDRLGPLVGSPNEPIRTPETVYFLLTASVELRGVLVQHPAAKMLLQRGGQVAAAVLTQPQVCKVFRELVPAQRSAVSADWVAGKAVFDTGYAALRTSLRSTVPRNRLHSLSRRLSEFLRTNPEWVLGVLSLLLVCVGIVRLLARPAASL